MTDNDDARNKGSMTYRLSNVLYWVFIIIGGGVALLLFYGFWEWLLDCLLSAPNDATALSQNLPLPLRPENYCGKSTDYYIRETLNQFFLMTIVFLFFYGIGWTLRYILSGRTRIGP